jgi:aryl-alcohol dehydrogenase-like predicted oxidoreductase
MSLAKRTLGQQGLEASEIGLGCLGMSAAYGTPEERDDRESIATIHRAVELGCSFAHAVHPVSALQSEYSLWERNLEAEIIPVLHKLDIGLVPFAPLGRGFLTRRAKRAEEYPEGDFRRSSDPRFQGENFDANMRAVEAVRDVARTLGGTPGQVALAWLLRKGQDIVPIPGSKRVAHLEENVAAASVVLDTTQVHALDKALAPEEIAGARYTSVGMSMVDR